GRPVVLEHETLSAGSGRRADLQRSRLRVPPAAGRDRAPERAGTIPGTPAGPIRLLAADAGAHDAEHRLRGPARDAPGWTVQLREGRHPRPHAPAAVPPPIAAAAAHGCRFPNQGDPWDSGAFP